MDESSDRSRTGGTIHPGNLADLALASIRRRAATLGVRYELRDPFAEVTYRSASLSEIIAQADKIGSDRFTEIDAAEQRTTVRKVDGQWQRGPQRPAPAPHTAGLVNERDEVVDRSSDRAQAVPDGSPASRAATANPAHLDALAERAALARRLEMELAERYVIKHGPTWFGGVSQTEYRFRGNLERIAFTEARYRLATDSNNPSVARSMIDVAQAREWRGLRVSGHDDFRRMVWLEASLRGIRTSGYEPVPGDLELLHSERDARRINRIEPGAEAKDAAPTAAKASARGSGTRKTVLAAIDAVLVAQRVPDKRREAILAAAAANLNRRLAAGEVHKVKLYDKSAAPQRASVKPTLEPQRNRDRAAPAR